MSLDFAMVNSKGEILGNIPISIDTHGKIFYCMEPNKFRLLEKIRDYYSDVYFPTDELVEVTEELISLKHILTTSQD